MDGAPVKGEPSQREESEPVSLTDTFRKICPSYMVMGMTYDQFWHSNTVVHKAYREAWEAKRQNDEWARWRQGAYFYDALLRVAPVMRAFGKGKVEPGKYPEEPWPLSEKEARAREKRDRIAAYNRMKAKLFAEAKRDRKRKTEVTEEKEASSDG